MNGADASGIVASPAKSHDHIGNLQSKPRPATRGKSLLLAILGPSNPAGVCPESLDGGAEMVVTFLMA